MNEISHLAKMVTSGLTAWWSHECGKYLKHRHKMASDRLIKNQQGATCPGNQGGASTAALGATFGDRLRHPHQGAALAHRSVFSPEKGSGNIIIQRWGLGGRGQNLAGLGVGGYGRG